MLDDLNEELLTDLAGEGAFQRGRRYYRNGNVEQLVCGPEGIRAMVTGTSDYTVLLGRRNGELEWGCTCPAAADGSFCKHLVAVALAAREGGDAQSASAAGMPADKAALLQALKQQDAETLADWLFEIARKDSLIEQRLRARVSLVSPEALKESLKAALRTGGFLDYRRSMAYAQQLQAPLTMLSDILESEPGVCADLCEYAVNRLFKIYERADDSAGSIGDQLHCFADLHARAVSLSGQTGKKLATLLYKLKLKDDWAMFPLQAYWEALGSVGQRHYADKVEKEFSALPVVTKQKRYPGPPIEHYPVLHRREELAFVQGDLDVLVALYSRDLPAQYAYFKLVEACRRLGHDAQAMSWAERGVKEHPEDSRLLQAQAQEYQRAGLIEEAVNSAWEAWRHSPYGDSWRDLKVISGKDWPTWRERALALLADQEVEIEDGRRNASERLSLLMNDGDIGAAVALAREQAAHPGDLQRLAEQCVKSHPADAAALLRRCLAAQLPGATSRHYRGLVRLMKKARDADPGSETDIWLKDVRDQYARRPALMECMDKAGL